MPSYASPHASRNGDVAATLKLLAAWLKEDHGVTLVPLQTAMGLAGSRALASR